MKKIKISFSPAMLCLLVCMIGTTPMTQLCACLGAAAIHELGHVVAAKLLDINLTHLKLDVLGARLDVTGRLCSYSSLAALCAAGPMINIICFALALSFRQRAAWIDEFCVASLSLGVLNLIPVQGFDGGRIIHGILSIFLPLALVERICSLLGFISLFCMWLLSVWLILRTGTSLTLFVFSCCLFGMLFM